MSLDGFVKHISAILPCFDVVQNHELFLCLIQLKSLELLEWKAVLSCAGAVPHHAEAGIVQAAHARAGQGAVCHGGAVL